MGSGENHVLSGMGGLMDSNHHVSDSDAHVWDYSAQECVVCGDRPCPEHEPIAWTAHHGRRPDALCPRCGRCFGYGVHCQYREQGCQAGASEV